MKPESERISAASIRVSAGRGEESEREERRMRERMRILDAIVGVLE